MRRFALLVSMVVLALLAQLPPGLAEEVTDADRTAIQTVISDQIAAFRRDDSAAAYTLAAPGILGLFPTADEFMDMVKHAYQPVYRPQSVAYGPLKDGPDGPEQQLFITGPDGRRYIATYTLERQPDGTWLIGGCVLTRDSSPAI
jgi:hypothetical protein